VRPLQSDAAVVCWDLDNTLVNSGVLIHDGRRLHEAVVEAEPMANMFAFYAALREQLPGARHVFLSARPRSMRRVTLDWLERHELAHEADTVWFVPFAGAKPRVWATLAQIAPLVIVDDLTYDHESERPSVYHDLVETARRTAAVYVGIDQITQMAADPEVVATIVAETIRQMQPPRSPSSA
jgi:hypothetical protein